MRTPSPVEINAFVLFVMEIYRDSAETLLKASIIALQDGNRQKAQEFFRQRGIDYARVTKELLVSCAKATGWYQDQFVPQKTFADMAEAVKQFNMGLFCGDAELFACLQLSPVQRTAVERQLALPYNIQSKVQMKDWDKWVADETLRAISTDV